MNGNELESILNEYINQQISFVKYREKRAVFIHAYVNSSFTSDDTVPINSVEASTSDPIDSYLDRQSSHSTEDKFKKNFDVPTANFSQTSHMAGKQYFILTILVVLAVLSWFLSSQQPNVTIENPTIILSSTNQAAEEVSNNLVFIDIFLIEKEWTSELFSDFLVEWQTLSKVDKKNARHSDNFIRLKNTIQQRVLEEKALQNINNTSDRHLKLLIWFASKLQIPVT